MARTIAKDHAEKRLAILGKAAEFFAANGYERSSMNQLAEACGVSKALIYHYYNSKEALLYDIVHTHLSDLLDTLLAVDQAATSPDDTLRGLVQAILLAYRDADAEHKVQTAAMASLPDEQRAVLADLQRQMVAIVADILKAITPEVYAQNPEKLRPVAMTLFGMVNWFYMWHRPAKGLSREDYADLVTDLVLGGVRGL
ncbi:MAG: TetR/AcrR family transcriptional regulator [Rhodobacter sp.]|jgi:AcrR family transcriptional regulator|nr:TetR/AcrR family transcriptional regulator [Rhodobacter sp.]